MFISRNMFVKFETKNREKNLDNDLTDGDNCLFDLHFITNNENRNHLTIMEYKIEWPKKSFFLHSY